MKFYLDNANVKEIQKAASLGRQRYPYHPPRCIPTGQQTLTDRSRSKQVSNGLGAHLQK